MPSLLVARPGFRRLWMAGATSLVGDWLSFVAVGMLALDRGGGPLDLALVLAAHALPAALLSPVWGAVVDRFDRRRLLVLADAAAGLVTIGMAAAAAAGWLGAVQMLLLARSALTAVVPPAESAALRHVVAPDELGRANAILAGTWSVAFVLGMALGGAVATLGPALAILLDAATFLAAAGLHALLPALPVEQGRALPLPALLAGVPADTAEALREAARRPALLRAVLGKTPVALAGGAGWLALNLVSASAAPFGSAALSFGLLQAVRGAGTGIGPAGATWLVRRGASAERLAVAASLAAYAGIAALAVARSPAALVIVSLVWGVGTGTNWVLAHTALQRESGDAVIGRLAAFDELLVTVAMVASAFAGAWITTHTGVAAGAVGGAAIGGAGSLLVLAITRPGRG
jgi:MFS family permease